MNRKRFEIRQAPEVVALGLILLLGGGLLLRLGASEAPTEVEIGGYATSLRGRTPGQRHNARQAAVSLNGRVIGPGETFSFNRVVRSWSEDRGYVKAPVSYDGELVKAFGGGVCQTSTTFYNAALLAGLPILERHPHVFAPHYVPPGRDAAVAQREIDLRVKNPYPWPIRIRCQAEGDRLEVHLYGAKRPVLQSEVFTRVLATETPSRMLKVVHRPGISGVRCFVRNPGAIGYRVVSFRSFLQNGREIKRERLGDDTYQAMDRMVQVVE